MAKKFNEVLTKMVEATGIPVTNETITKILGNSTLSEIDVDDDVANTLMAERFTIDAAKNNPLIANHFKAQTFNGVDAEIDRLAKEYELSDEDIEELKKADNSFKRIALLPKKVKDILEKKGAKVVYDKEASKQEIEKLNGQIAEIKNLTKKEKDDLLSSFDKERLDFKMNLIYDQFIPKMDDKKKPNINGAIAQTVINNALQEKGLSIKNKDGNPALLTKDDQDYFENNVKVTPDTFIGKILANEGLLTMSKKQEQKKNEPFKRTVNNEGGLKTEKAVSAYDEMLQEEEV